MQSVQNNVVQRLGDGDAARGWQLFGALDSIERVSLEAYEERGNLTEEMLTRFRVAAACRLERVHGTT